MEELSVPEGWVRWATEDDGSGVLVYRPDVFDGDAHPAPCLPTISLSRGSRSRTPGVHPTTAAGAWTVSFTLEPGVAITHETHADRTEAYAAVESLMRRFVAGEIDYRAAYDDPRPPYLSTLDELCGDGA